MQNCKNQKSRKALLLFVVIFAVALGITYKKEKIAFAATFDESPPSSSVTTNFYFGTTTYPYYANGSELVDYYIQSGKLDLTYHGGGYSTAGLFGGTAFSIQLQSPYGGNPDLYVLFRDNPTGGGADWTDWIHFHYNAGTWSYINSYIPIPNGYTPSSTFFTSISVSTSTARLKVQGYWQSSSTILVTQSTENSSRTLNLYPTNFGGSGFTNSSSTGAFDLDFKINQEGCTVETSSTTICTTDQTYTYQAVLYDGHYPNQTYPYKDIASTTLIYPYSGTSTIFSSDFSNQFYNATLGTSTLISSTQFLSFLNVPRLLQERVPFAYIFQIANGIRDGINSSTTAEIPVGNFSWHNTQNGTTTFDFFSPATIKVYMSDTIIALWRGFLLTVLIINFGYALYYETKRHHII